MLIYVNTVAQIDPNIKQKVDDYPRTVNNYHKLATLINNDFNSPIDKAGAIYYWIGQNIEYDIKEAQKAPQTIEFSYQTEEEKTLLLQKYNDKIVKKVLKKRQGVCDGYARLFKSICDATDIDCIIIDGTSKTTPNDIGKAPKYSDHSWNAIRINQQWQLIDCTWGAGYTVNNIFTKDYSDVYFLTKPELFFLKHFPNDKKWLLVDKDEKDFTNLPMFYSSYLDSGLEIISPEKGIITKASKKGISFKIITTIPSFELRYKFSNEKKSNAIEMQKKNSNYTFTIPLNNRRKGYLTIFHEGRALVTYKLKL